MSGPARKARSALVERAVKATQLYLGCTGLVRVQDQQKLYTRMQKAVERVATHYKVAEDEASRQISEEAQRRGPRCPMPGKDI